MFYVRKLESLISFNSAFAFIIYLTHWVTKTEYLLTISIQYQPVSVENKEKYQFGDKKLI